MGIQEPTRGPACDASDTLTAEANHRVANSLSLIAGFARLVAARVAREGRTMGSEEVASLLRDVAARIQGVGLLHQLLAHRPEGERVDLQDYLRRLCADLQSGFGFAGRVELGQVEPGCCVPADLARPVAVMVSELVTNAMKYAHPTGVTGVVRIGCRHADDGSLVLEVIDDGVGLPENFDMACGGGLGLRLVRSLCAPLGGTVSFDSSPLGLSVRIVLPVPAVAEAA
jgi:two-component sensor histidine kinase